MGTFSIFVINKCYQPNQN
ncbi:erythromycin resistance leader peptide [Staphylococcus aureus]